MSMPEKKELWFHRYFRDPSWTGDTNTAVWDEVKKVHKEFGREVSAQHYEDLRQSMLKTFSFDLMNSNGETTRAGEAVLDLNAIVVSDGQYRYSGRCNIITDDRIFCHQLKVTHYDGPCLTPWGDGVAEFRVMLSGKRDGDAIAGPMFRLDRFGFPPLAFRMSPRPALIRHEEHSVRTTQYERDEALVKQVAGLLGVGDASFRNPNCPPASESGVDVEVTLGSKTIGIQVTSLYADEGQNPKGSQLQKKERPLVESGRVYTMSTVLDCIPALKIQIADKTQKTFDSKRFPEAWLLVAGGLPWAPAATAGFISWIDSNLYRMNRETGPFLRGSKYNRIFLYFHIGGTLYEWSGDQWRKIAGNSQ